MFCHHLFPFISKSVRRWKWFRCGRDFAVWFCRINELLTWFEQFFFRYFYRKKIVCNWSGKAFRNKFQRIVLFFLLSSITFLSRLTWFDKFLQNSSKLTLSLSSGIFDWTQYRSYQNPFPLWVRDFERVQLDTQNSNEFFLPHFQINKKHLKCAQICAYFTVKSCWDLIKSGFIFGWPLSLAQIFRYLWSMSNMINKKPPYIDQSCAAIRIPNLKTTNKHHILIHLTDLWCVCFSVFIFRINQIMCFVSLTVQYQRIFEIMRSSVITELLRFWSVWMNR